MENNQPQEKEIPPEPPRDVQILDAKPVQEKNADSRNVFIGTLNVFNAPVQKYLGEPLRRRYHRHYHPRHKHGTKHFIADILLVLVVVALLSANIYAAFFLAPGLPERVQLTLVTTPETVTSGDFVTLTFSYKNDNDVALMDAHLAVFLPKYFSHITVTPASFDERTHTFSLGRIAAGGNGVVTVRGQLLGSIGTDVEAGAVLSYAREGAGFNDRRESKGVSFSIPLLQSTIRLSVAVPEVIVHEGTASFLVQYENIGKPPIAELIVQPNFGDPLHLLESSVPLTDGVFRMTNIAQGGRGEIRGQLALRAHGEETTIFAVQAFVAGAALLQSEAKRVVRVFYPKLALSPLYDGERDVITLGSALEFSFVYENNEAEDMLDLTVTIDPPSAVFSRDAKIATTITRQEDSALALVRAGKKGTIHFSLLTNETLDRKSFFGTGDPIVRIPYIVSYRLASAPDRLIQFTRTDERKLQSDFAIDAFGRYYTPEGDQLGRGSLPPRVGETTRYWVFLPLTNTISDIADVVVTAELGAHAAWTRKSSVTLGDPLAYDERTRTVTWRLPRVTKYSGGEYPDVGAAFEVAVTPEADDLGKEPLLLTNIRVRGQDTFTRTTIEREAATVTTKLSVDRKASNKGKVVP